jgi:DNA-binding response OmpR family regulator
MIHEKLRSVLIVADDAQLREALEGFLIKSGHSVRKATNGLEGLEIFKIHGPSLVITDYTMPKMNGEALIEMIRKIDLTVPVILMTAGLSDKSILELLRFDRFTTLRKPFGPSTLLSALSQAQSTPVSSENHHFRKAFRVDVDLPVTFNSGVPGRVKNLSSLGLFLETPAMIPMKSEISMNISLPSPVKASGSVIWDKPSAGIGVSFCPLTPDATYNIQNFLMNEMKKLELGWL